VSSSVGGLGGGLGFAGISPSVGVEFDTWNNGSVLGDPSDNHVGIDLDGSVASVVTANVATPMDNGATWYAWVDYDGTTLEMRLAQTPARPALPTLSHAVNLTTVLGTSQAYVGFTSGTGAAYANHDVLTWRFDNAYAPIGSVPVAGTQPVPTLSPRALLVLVLLAAAAGGYAMRRRRA
jgi:hypothetical protein